MRTASCRCCRRRTAASAAAPSGAAAVVWQRPRLSPHCLRWLPRSSLLPPPACAVWAAARVCWPFHDSTASTRPPAPVWAPAGAYKPAVATQNTHSCLVAPTRSRRGRRCRCPPALLARGCGPAVLLCSQRRMRTTHHAPWVRGRPPGRPDLADRQWDRLSVRAAHPSTMPPRRGQHDASWPSLVCRDCAWLGPPERMSGWDWWNHASRQACVMSVVRLGDGPRRRCGASAGACSSGFYTAAVSACLSKE